MLDLDALRLAAELAMRQPAARPQAHSWTTTIHVHNHPGGYVLPTIARLGYYPRVVIDGRCDSACAWAFVMNRNACFTMRATFGFHRASYAKSGEPAREYTLALWHNLPASLRPVAADVLRSDELVRVGAWEMWHHYPGRVCDETDL